MKEKLMTISELSIEFGLNKSKLNYYARRGLISPVRRLGITMIFDKKEVQTILKKIEAKKKKGKMLEEIKEELK